MVKLQWKIWLEKNNQKAFGPGPKELLSKVDELGSLRQAAAVMDMSYSKAWSIINIIEDSLEIKLLDKKVGGNEGGGSELTEEGKQLLIKYSKFESKVDEVLENIFQDFFS